MVESKLVELVVAGSNPVGHPISLNLVIPPGSRSLTNTSILTRLPLIVRWHTLLFFHATQPNGRFGAGQNIAQSADTILGLKSAYPHHFGGDHN